MDLDKLKAILDPAARRRGFEEWVNDAAAEQQVPVYFSDLQPRVREKQHGVDAEGSRSEPPPADVTHFVLPRGNHTMVKEANFFREQGGIKDDWGRRWVPVRATSIEDARRQGAEMEPIHPMWKSKKPSLGSR